MLPGAASADRLELRPHGHICIIGNTLADRMQHSGWLETMIVARHPDFDLVFRNLGFSGDELKTRLRTQDFGTPDEWLRRTRADVIFALFGFNESFNGLESQSVPSPTAAPAAHHHAAL